METNIKNKNLKYLYKAAKRFRKKYQDTEYLIWNVPPFWTSHASNKDLIQQNHEQIKLDTPWMCVTYAAILTT